MGQDNQEFINKAKDSLEELAGKTKEIFGDVKNRNEARMEGNPSQDDNNDWSNRDRKHAAGEFEFQTRNQYQNGAQLDAVPDFGNKSAGGDSRYTEQEPVTDFTELGVAGGEAAVEDAVEGSRADYGTEAVYGDPTGRYDGNEANMLGDAERRKRYDEQDSLDNYLDEAEGPEHPGH
ncbi:hypothetical protein AV656_05615 [Bhargavaea cecembensis]|uniref:Uncharacterized protein n=1 Tax=Bhargavaea cecembensis TaxID=394098 RepID=A0A161SLB8_9BACL|nr:hypothetical protein [Bhargavaea cecembensis]KZE38393.1 hypothetical protein AV656_05615 [Bhargavaea cecembensis]